MAPARAVAERVTSAGQAMRRGTVVRLTKDEPRVFDGDTARLFGSSDVSVPQQVLNAREALVNGSGKLFYFQKRGISEETVKDAYVGYESGAFLYPCIGRGGGLLGVHHKGEARDGQGKRKQWWGGYAEDLPPKGRGKRPDDPAKIIPFGLETLKGLEPGALVVLCCGEEDALSLRQRGYTALSQPGAGLLEPVYARELAGFAVTVFYDAGEEQEAHKDALKLLEAGAESVRVVPWPKEEPHGSDVNGKLAEDPENFEAWVAGMLKAAKPVSSVTSSGSGRDGRPDVYSSYVPEQAPWPVLKEEALHGLPGEIVRAVEPHTESDPVAVLVNVLAAFGNAIGRGAYMRVGADAHNLRIDAALGGRSSKARKGTSWGYVRELMASVDPPWVYDRVQDGLSSGEGLIHAVRDPVLKENKKTGETETQDEGAKDKRLLVVAQELASVLKVMNREGNTLSPVIRQAWDGNTLQIMTKNSPSKSTGSHISIVGHITREELLRHLNQTETANGFANRFLWLMVKRSRGLPFGGEWHLVDKEPLIERLRSVLEFGRRPVEIGWSEPAKEMWRAVYGTLSEERAGLLAAVTGRAEAQTMRLAALYAVMGRSSLIQVQHLEAALALWQYAEESARYIFGDATGDPEADQILDALRVAGKSGMSRTEIRGLFGRNKKADRISRALALLLKSGRVRREQKETGGRPSERWFAK